MENPGFGLFRGEGCGPPPPLDPCARRGRCSEKKNGQRADDKFFFRIPPRKLSDLFSTKTRLRDRAKLTKMTVERKTFLWEKERKKERKKNARSCSQLDLTHCFSHCEKMRARKCAKQLQNLNPGEFLRTKYERTGGSVSCFCCQPNEGSPDFDQLFFSFTRALHVPPNGSAQLNECSAGGVDQRRSAWFDAH